ncbi:hypothetical protein FACS1894106_2450 [Spirochaetia bacterium]|nr:hypothetical protein FACS1894106_2450 [Spirochaetia bacterium]
MKNWGFVLISILVLITFISCGRSKEYKLFSACLEEDAPAVQILLDEGVLPDSILYDNDREIIGNLYIQKKDMKFASNRERDQYLITFSLSPLGIISSIGNINIAKILLDAGADINKKSGSRSRTPLLLSTVDNNTDFSLFLSENNANINNVDSFGATALHYAVFNDNIIVVEKLLSLGADINKQNNEGATPLVYAVARENAADIELLELLLSSNADPNIQYNTSIGSINALYAAVSNNHVESAKVLLKFKSDHNIKDSNGRTVFDLAESNGFDDISEILKPYDRSGYKDYIFGMSVEQVKEKSPDLKSNKSFFGFYQGTYSLQYLYYNELITIVPNPLQYENGSITSYESEENDLIFYFLNRKLIAVSVTFVLENILPELKKQYGDISTVRGRSAYVGNTYQTATWNKEKNRIIVYDDSLGVEQITYIDKDWLQPLLDKTMAEFRKGQSNTRSRLD